MHPGSRALRATRCGSARSGRGSLDGHPAHSRTRAHPCARPCGRFRPALAAADGAQDQERRREKLFCSGFGAQDARALLFPGPHGIAAAAVDQAPQECARWIARIPLLHRMCNQRNPAAGASGAMRWGVFFAYFLCTSKESRPLAKGEWKLRLLKAKNSKGKSWIPAYAGMTSGRAKTLDSGFRRNDEQKQKARGIPRQETCSSCGGNGQCNPAQIVRNNSASLTFTIPSAATARVNPRTSNSLPAGTSRSSFGNA